MLQPILKWIERTLIAVGVVLALWSGARLVEERFFSALPVPPPATTPTPLPGDHETAGPKPTPEVHAAPARGAWVARLEAPSVQLAATVLEGSDDATLAHAAGHIEDTAFPGRVGNVGIAGHRDSVFRPVRKMKIGDQLLLTTADHVYEYEITKTQIVTPDDVWVLDPTEKPTLTLVTCYPFNYVGSAPKRYIVWAALMSDWER